MESAGKIQYSDRPIRNLDRSIRQMTMYMYVYIYIEYYPTTPTPPIPHPTHPNPTCWGGRGEGGVGHVGLGGVGWGIGGSGGSRIILDIYTYNIYIYVYNSHGLTLVATSKWTFMLGSPRSVNNQSRLFVHKCGSGPGPGAAVS